MSYRLEGKDIVISGFENGIADNPYSGIADMRNMEIISLPGEASVEFKTVVATKPPVMNAIAYTAQASGDTITVANTTGLYVGCAIVLASNTAGGLSNSVVYYVFNITATTFQVRLGIALGSAIDISSDGTGTLTTYQYGNQRGTNAIAPISYWVDRTGASLGVNAVYLVDGSNYVWVIFNSVVGTFPAKSLIFLGNIGGIGAASTGQNGIAIAFDYLFLFGSNSVDVLDIGGVWSGGPAADWTYNWKTSVSIASSNSRVGTLLSQEDGNLYWTSITGLGSLIENPGEVFNPSTADTYTFNDSALLLPDNDRATCIAELGNNLLIGGRRSIVYAWDKISIGFTAILNMSDTFTRFIVTAGQNAYVFSGNRGRIYITNGASIDRYKKFPDYVTGAIAPNIRWRDANFTQNQLIFTMTATNNAGTTLNTVAGVWAIDLDSGALRLLNKTTNSGYTGTAMMAVEVPPDSSGSTTGVVGTQIMVGWFSGTTYDVDVPSVDPYTNYESYLHSDMIPVGTFLDPFSPSQIEWKTSAPLVAGEGVKLSYRTNINENFTLISESTTAGAISDLYQANFQKVQWVQILAEIKSTATTPSYTRLTEIRIRDWPSGKNNR